MARSAQEKCRIRSKLDSQEVQQRHGFDGNGRWNPKYCHNCSSYYHRWKVRNHAHKQQRRGQQTEQALPKPKSSTSARGATLEILAPAIPVALIH